MNFNFDELDTLASVLHPKTWIFAKTMPENPHWYTLRKAWQDDPQFDQVVMTMRKIGYTEMYHGRPYTMVNINGLKYWTMGAPIPATILINRKVIEMPNHYDDIAGEYDSLFKDQYSLDENEQVFKLLDYQPGEEVLDIGCGTGLFLDYVKPTGYSGIDPSNGMLEVLGRKHPKFANATVKTPFEEYCGPQVDLVVSLFGSANYIDPDAIDRITRFVKKGGRWFVMFYKPSYHPVVCERSGKEISHHPDNFLFLPGQIRELNNFLIVSGLK